MVVREVTERSLEEYVMEQMAAGCTTLSALIASNIDLSRGRCFLIMPESLVTRQVQNWNWDPGHFKSQEADNILARLIGRYLRNIANRVLIQDFEQRRSDPHFANDPLWLSYGEELYWELQGTDISEAKIEECIWNASYWPWISYFCKARTDRSRSIVAEDLEAVALHLVGVAIQVLHDSYVIWWRTDLEQFPDL